MQASMRKIDHQREKKTSSKENTWIALGSSKANAKMFSSEGPVAPSPSCLHHTNIWHLGNHWTFVAQLLILVILRKMTPLSTILGLFFHVYVFILQRGKKSWYL